MIVALVDGGGNIVNRVLVNDLAAAQALYPGDSCVDDDAGLAIIGGAYADGTFFPPAPPPPDPAEATGIAKRTYAASLRGRATTLSNRGKTVAAMQLLLEAQRVDSNV